MEHEFPSHTYADKFWQKNTAGSKSGQVTRVLLRLKSFSKKKENKLIVQTLSHICVLYDCQQWLEEFQE